MKSDEDPFLDPRTEAARIRAFFVHPGFARKGVGSAILDASVSYEQAGRVGAVDLEPVGTGHAGREAEVMQNRSHQRTRKRTLANDPFLVLVVRGSLALSDEPDLAVGGVGDHESF